jgi:DNA-directed RNA polymerase specialized sigma24 family protein
MSAHEPTRQPDALLLPFLRATDEADSRRVLGQLIAGHADPVIQEVIRRKLRGFAHRPEDAEDVRGEVIAQLLTRLSEFKTNPNGTPISNFRGYIATTALHACYTHLRQKYPQRWSLRDRLRYLLNHQAGLALWEIADGEWLCGFAAWRDQKKTVAPDVSRWSDPRAFRKNVQRMKLADLVTAIFNDVGSPVELDGLVNLVAELLDIKDSTSETMVENEKPLALEDVPAAAPPPFDALEWREELRWLWEQIRLMPLEQRRAFLLNSEVMEEFVLHGVASDRDIAAALEMPSDELSALWNSLPLGDDAIARRFHLNRASVPKWRQRARERLGRGLEERV